MIINIEEYNDNTIYEIDDQDGVGVEVDAAWFEEYKRCAERFWEGQRKLEELFRGATQ